MGVGEERGGSDSENAPQAERERVKAVITPPDALFSRAPPGTTDFPGGQLWRLASPLK